MPKYLVQASYIGDGVQGLRQEGGTARRAVVEKACTSVGGKLDAFYYAFGETDVVVDAAVKVTGDYRPPGG